jgi:outer membrane protein assembly factor BamB
LFVQCDNEERSFVAAFDRKTGAELWRANRSEKSTWGTPVVWRNTHRTELVCMGARRIRSYEPTSGRVLWELATEEGSVPGRSAPGAGLGSGPSRPGADSANSGGAKKSAGGKPAAGGCKSTPVATRERIFVGMAPRVSGQALGPIWAVKAGASGDISLKPNETSNEHIAWFRPNAGPHFASAVICDERLFVVTPHGGELRCFDAMTGADLFQQRLPRAGDFKASPWTCDGKVFALDENGTTFVVAASGEFQLLATNHLDELCWATPAIADGAIFVRGVEHLFCVRRPSGDGVRANP